MAGPAVLGGSRAIDRQKCATFLTNRRLPVGFVRYPIWRENPVIGADCGDESTEELYRIARIPLYEGVLRNMMLQSDA